MTNDEFQMTKNAKIERSRAQRSVVRSPRSRGPWSCSPWSRSPVSAFTLLELLVVIGIIALIRAIALPVVRSFKPDPLKTASTQLLNDLAYARHRAIADHTTVYVA